LEVFQTNRANFEFQSRWDCVLDLGQNNMVTQVRKLHSKLIYTQVPGNVFHAVASLITMCTKEALKVLKPVFFVDQSRESQLSIAHVVHRFWT
jgi:hypothetical protein